ncbi:PREDICTED: stress response protein NST1-like [Camelina sativa]|uniref:Stress response protein NST1-like n=1 Tax=Camelina sativa TaxID=90675 RepID=A0ABM0U6W3_CAMSA|nr:PREDICTED: stress response protein NST1-like [Camelina sativa]
MISDSNSTQDPIIHNPNVLLDSSQIDNGPKTVTREEPVKTRKRRSKKDESKPEKPKQVRRRKPKTVSAEENKKKEEMGTVSAEENKKKEEMGTGMDGVGMFMETLLDDLTASRERLMDWVKTELYGASDENVASRPPLKKRGVAAAVAAKRPVKKRMTKKKKEEEEKMKKKEEEERESEKQRKPSEHSQEMNTPEEKISEIAPNGRDLDCIARPLDRFLEGGEGMYTPKEKTPEIALNGGECGSNAGLLDRFLKGGPGGFGRNYFQQLQEDQEALVTQTEMENSKNETVKSQKSIVLAIQAPNLSKKQKKTSEANTNKNRSSMVERTGQETQTDHNFGTPFASQLSSSSSLQSFPVFSSLFPKLSSQSLLPSFPVSSSLFPFSSQGVTPLASNTNFELRQPVAQTPDLSEFQTGVQGFENSMFHNNGYFSGFPAAFQPHLLAGGYNFPQQLNSATSSQQREDNNMFGGLRMAGGAIRYSGNRVPEAEVGNCINGFSEYRTSSGR